MKKILFFKLLVFTQLAFAQTYYRHIPFTLTLSQGDSVQVDYNYSGKIGIRCVSTKSGIKLHYAYNGHEKVTLLPAILQSDHIPETTMEQLADVDGEFALKYHDGNMASKKLNKITCTYVNKRF